MPGNTPAGNTYVHLRHTNFCRSIQLIRVLGEVLQTIQRTRYDFCTFTEREKRRLRVIENSVMKSIFGPTREDWTGLEEVAEWENPMTCTPHQISYVYWTVHHLDSWIKRDQLDVTCFFISLFHAQHVSDVNTSILRSFRLICWVSSRVVLLWYDVCWCYVVVTPTHIVPEQYNPWTNSTNKSKAPEDGCINIRNMLSMKSWNKKASDIKLVSLYSTISKHHSSDHVKKNEMGGARGSHGGEKTYIQHFGGETWGKETTWKV